MEWLVPRVRVSHPACSCAISPILQAAAWMQLKSNAQEMKISTCLGCLCLA